MNTFSKENTNLRNAIANSINNELGFTADLQIEQDEFGVSYTLTNLRLWKNNRFQPYTDKSADGCDFEEAKSLFWIRWAAWSKRTFGYVVRVEITSTLRF